MNPYDLFLLIWVHFVGDFVLQSDDMAMNKSSSNYWLSFHIAVYTLVLWLGFGWKFALVNGILHFYVDWCTSRMNKYLWNNYQSKHWFFTGVGFDQALHMTCMVATLGLKS